LFGAGFIVSNISTLVITNRILVKKIIIAVDGFSSCGKSTLAKALSKKLSYAYIDTGAMYRAVTYYFLNNNISFTDNQAIQEALSKITITFKNINNQNTTFLNGQNIESEIRNMYVSNNVSEVAAISTVRRAMVQQQQEMGKTKGIVMDGRDIGTVVFPNAELKIFLTANEDTRADRRYKEMLAKGQEATLEAVKANLTKRDRIDSTRADSPLRKADDAVEVDNSHLSQEEQLQIVYDLAMRVIEGERLREA